MHKADLLPPSCFALANVFAGSARRPRSISARSEQVFTAKGRSVGAGTGLGMAGGGDGSPRPLSTGCMRGSEALSSSLSPPRLAGILQPLPAAMLRLRAVGSTHRVFLPVAMG